MLHDPIAPLKAKAQAEVEKFQHVAIALRLLLQPRENREDLFAAPGLVVKARQQRVLGPVALLSPGRTHYRLVDKRAEHVTEGQQRGPVVALFGELDFDGRDLIDYLTIEPLDVAHLVELTYPQYHTQQRTGGIYQRIEVVAAQA